MEERHNQTEISFYHETNNRSEKPSASEPLRLQSMPCKISHDGSAPVKSYFDSMSTEDTESSKHLRNSFRGRPLIGEKLSAPDGYTFFIAQEADETPSSIADSHSDDQNTDVKFEVKDQTNTVTVWNLDATPTDKDPIRKAINWIKVAEALAN